MNVETGNLLPLTEIEKLSPAEQSKFVQVQRDLIKIEEELKQINKYAPCGCGSGKKFKFCCYKEK